MYTQTFQFFGLRDNPFKMSPSFAFVSQRMQSVWAQLTNGIEAGKGLLVLTGEVGTGKTTMVKHLMAWLDERRVPRAFIFNPHLEPNELFETMLACFGVPSKARQPGDARQRLNRWLAERPERVKPVLIIDEAQGLPLHVLEEVRLLLNQETAGEKSLQVVLCGQPEFNQTLMRPDLRQIRQRIEVRCSTAALDRDETHAYIQTLLDVAGAAGRAAFTPEAADAIYLYARGTPRVINLLCENSLFRAAAQRLQPVPAEIANQVAGELQFDELRPVGPPKSSSKIDWGGPVVRPPGAEAFDPPPENAAALAPISGARMDFGVHTVAGPGLSDSCVARLDAPDVRSAKAELPNRSSGNPRRFEPGKNRPQNIWMCDNRSAAARLSQMSQRSSRAAREALERLFAAVVSSLVSLLCAVPRRFSSRTNWVRERTAALRQWLIFATAARRRVKSVNSVAPLRANNPAARQ